MGSFGEQVQAAIAAQISAEIAAMRPKVSQAEIAKRAGISTSALSRYLKDPEDEMARDIPLPVFADIAQALGLSPRELYDRAMRRLGGNDVA
jgi:transcriptional regulator with XRE-family HTH domain